MRVVWVLIFFVAVGVYAHAETFGEKINLTEKTSIEDLLARASKGEIKNPILVEATVEKVCKASGCWMTIKAPTDAVRITFKDYGFFVPAKLEGKKVLVQGDAVVHKMSLKETKHYVKDAGGDPSKVTEGRTEVRVVASGVQGI